MESGDTEYWGQPFPNNEEIIIFWRQGDIWEEGDMMAWPVCGWDTFDNFPWWTLAGQDHVVIPKRGVYIISIYIGYWLIMNFDWLIKRAENECMFEAWVTKNGVAVAKQTQGYFFDGGFYQSENSNMLMTMVRCNEGDVIDMRVRHGLPCWFTDVVGGLGVNTQNYGFMSDTIQMRIQLIPGTQGEEV